MSVSIREVAERAGVSLGTVSKSLNGGANAQIAASTRERVRRAAAELGYHPSAVARALVRKQMDTLGIVLPPGQASPLRVPFFAALSDAILEAAARHHQNITLYTGHSWQNASLSLPRFRDGRCDGLLLFYQPESSDIITALLDTSVPTVLVSDTRVDPRLSCVDVDNVPAAQAMTEYLLSLGHQRIALVCGRHLTYVLPRLEGYKRALQNAGIAFNPALVTPDLSDDWWGSLSQQLDDLLRLPPNERPTALFCATDEIAVPVLHLLAERGVSVPGDISVAGFNDDSSADRQTPALTTMRQPYEAIADKAVSLLLAQIADISVRGTKEAHAAQLIVRASTAPPPQ